MKTINGNYTLALADKDSWMKVLTAAVITIPQNRKIALPVGTIIGLRSDTDASVSIKAQKGVVLQSFENKLKLAGRNAVVYLEQEDINVWNVVGILKA